MRILILSLVFLGLGFVDQSWSKPDPLAAPAPPVEELEVREATPPPAVIETVEVEVQQVPPPIGDVIVSEASWFRETLARAEKNMQPLVVIGLVGLSLILLILWRLPQRKEF